jgi:Protein of unknown function (DUF3105)
MSMSTQHGGGSRRPSIRPVAGAKPKPGVDDAAVDDTAVDDEELEVSSESAEDSPEPESTGTKSAPVKKASPAKTAKARSTATRSGTKSTTKSARPGAKGARPAAKGAGGRNRKMAPVRVSQGRNWSAIGLLAGVIAIAVGIVGFAGWQVYEHGLTWEQRADQINGLKNYRKSDPGSLAYQSHQFGPITYKYSPPVGGTHNPNWQRCQGDVYDAPIANEHAVHAMEHGAVWITYRPDLPKAQVEQLAKKVRGQDYMLMSPYPGLDKPVSVQTWGYQLKVDNASDGRIDEFIHALKQASQVEKGATCTTGQIITETGTTPHDLGKDQPQQQGGGGTGG